MSIPKDNDIVRGLGFVALYAAYLEEQIDDLLSMLHPVEPFTEKEKWWNTSRKIEKAKRIVSGLTFGYKDALLADLDNCSDLFKRRNEVIHGRIYAAYDRPDTLKSGRPNVLDREVDPEELYTLAEELLGARASLYRPMILQIPQLLKGWKGSLDVPRTQ